MTQQRSNWKFAAHTPVDDVVFAVAVGQLPLLPQRAALPLDQSRLPGLVLVEEPHRRGADSEGACKSEEEKH